MNESKPNQVQLPKWMTKLPTSWLTQIQDELLKPYLQNTLKFIHQEKSSGKTIFPPAQLVFKALEECPFDQIKVVILGQDPYHGMGQANGLSFSVSNGVALPPSLINIYKELKTDLGIDRGTNGNLSDWAKQGVLLLNSSLTVEMGQAGSHAGLGWRQFTDFIIRRISENKKGVVFILWGRFAQQKTELIDAQKHFILKAPHPSPLSAHRGFFGSKPFSKTNQILIQEGQRPIHWG